MSELPLLPKSMLTQQKGSLGTEIAQAFSICFTGAG
jgi:hypothetical protein